MTYYLMFAIQSLVLIQSLCTKEWWKALYWFAAILLTLAVKEM